EASEVAYRDSCNAAGGVPRRGTFRHKLRRSHNRRRAPASGGRRIVRASTYSTTSSETGNRSTGNRAGDGHYNTKIALPGALRFYWSGGARTHGYRVETRLDTWLYFLIFPFSPSRSIAIEKPSRR